MDCLSVNVRLATLESVWKDRLWGPWSLRWMCVRITSHASFFCVCVCDWVQGLRNDVKDWLWRRDVVFRRRLGRIELRLFPRLQFLTCTTQEIVWFRNTQWGLPEGAAWVERAGGSAHDSCSPDYYQRSSHISTNRWKLAQLKVTVSLCWGVCTLTP